MSKMRVVLGLAVAGTFAAASVRAQDGVRTELSGPALYKTYCSSCHGKEGRGDGPIADALRYRPADLTAIAKNAGGKFEKDKVHRMIDGREPVKGHGGPDMPLWGDAFKRSGDGYGEDAVKTRIDALVEYLEGLQQP